MRALRHFALSVTAGALALGGLAATSTSASAVVVDPDRLAVTVVGDGTTTGNVAVPVAIDLVDSFSERSRSVALPTTTDGAQRAFTLGADRDQQGALQQSVDHRYVTVGGYQAALGAPTNDSAAATTRRVIARIGTDSVDTSTALAGGYTTRHIRGVVSVDGSRYWAGGHGGDAPATGGIQTVAHGADATTPVTTGSANNNNVRVPVIFDGQLYATSDRSGFEGVNKIGTGIPTTTATPTRIAAPPAGSTVAHDFAFVGDALYVTYTEGTARLVKYVKQNDVWTAVGSQPGAYWGVTGRVAGTQTVLYAIKGAQQGNQLTQIVDAGGASAFTPTESVLRTAEAGKAFRGVAFAPGFTPGTGPVAVAPVKPTVAFTKRVAGGQGNALSGVVGDATNPVARGTVADPEGATITTTVSSSNATVVPAGAATVTVAPNGTFTLAVSPAAPGAATLTVTATTSDDRVGTATLSYRASAALADPTGRTYVGMSDASAAEDAGDGYFFVADDDSNEIRLFAPNGGEAVRELDVSGDIPAIQPGEAFDLEGSTRDGDTLYWVGSIGNTRSGNVRLDRDVVFATTVSGSGADATLTYAGHKRGVRQALVDWDHTNGHGLGADHYGFTAATQPGVSAEGPRSLNVEGAALAPDGTSMWLGFRSPLVPLPEGGDALIVPLETVAGVVAGGAAQFGAPIELDLDGRAIRDLERTRDGQYLIMAGSADDAGRFAVYGWTGDPDDQPVLSANLPSLADWPGSYESIVDAEGLEDGTEVRLLQDDGTVVIYGDGTQAQDLPAVELKKFVGQTVELDFDGAFDPPAATTTTLALSGSADGVVDLTATVGGVDSPTGTVSFREGDTEVGNEAITAGKATARLTDVTPGTHVYTAVFEPTGTTVNPSTSESVAFLVTATTLSATSSAPATVDLLATVTAGAVGTVTFREGDATVGSVDLVDGSAPLTLTNVSKGEHTYTATFTPTGAATSGSASTAEPVQVAAVPLRTTTYLRVTPTTGTYGQAREVRVQVKAGASFVPGETVTVRHESFTRTLTLDEEGRAQMIVQRQPAGTTEITATFDGTSELLESTASTTLRISQASSAVTVSGPSSISSTSRATLAASVRIVGAPSTLRPGGQVAVRIGSKEVGRGTLVNGEVRITLDRLPKGTHTLRVNFGGSLSVKSRLVERRIRVL